jgi:hypothetical protein
VGQVRIWKESDCARGTNFLETTLRDKLGHKKKVPEQGILTPWRLQRVGQLRIWKGGHTRETHFLETTEGGKGQDMEKKRLSKGHSQTGGHKCRDRS